eukprot:s315_g5.t3
MLVINSPHNPTGAAFDQSQLDAVSELLMKLPQAEPPVLFSDEMYGDMLGPQAPSMVGKRNAMVLSGLSKPWGMPGLRMGWLVCSDKKHFDSITSLRDAWLITLGLQILTKKAIDYTTLCLPPHSEILSIIALRNPDSFLSRNRDIAAKNYQVLQSVLQSLPQWFYPLNQHRHNDRLTNWRATVVFARLKFPLGGVADSASPTLKSAAALAEYLAQEHSTCMVVSDFFEFDSFPNLLREFRKLYAYGPVGFCNSKDEVTGPEVKQFLAELVAEHHSAHYNTSDYSNATCTELFEEHLMSIVWTVTGWHRHVQVFGGESDYYRDPELASFSWRENERSARPLQHMQMTTVAVFTSALQPKIIEDYSHVFQGIYKEQETDADISCFEMVKLMDNFRSELEQVSDEIGLRNEKRLHDPDMGFQNVHADPKIVECSAELFVPFELHLCGWQWLRHGTLKATASKYKGSGRETVIADLLQHQPLVVLLLQGWTLLLLGVAFCMKFDEDSFPLPGAIMPVAGTVGYILSGWAPSAILNAVLKLPPLVYVGKISYSIYLWHVPVAAICRWLTLGSDLAVEAKLCCVLSTTVLAVLSYHLLEAPTRKLESSSKTSLCYSFLAMILTAIFVTSLLVIRHVVLTSNCYIWLTLAALLFLLALFGAHLVHGVASVQLLYVFCLFSVIFGITYNIYHDNVHLQHSTQIRVNPEVNISTPRPLLSPESSCRCLRTSTVSAEIPSLCGVPSILDIPCIQNKLHRPLPGPGHQGPVASSPSSSTISAHYLLHAEPSDPQHSVKHDLLQVRSLCSCTNDVSTYHTPPETCLPNQCACARSELPSCFTGTPLSDADFHPAVPWGHENCLGVQLTEEEILSRCLTPQSQRTHGRAIWLIGDSHSFALVPCITPSANAAGLNVLQQKRCDFEWSKVLNALDEVVNPDDIVAFSACFYCMQWCLPHYEELIIRLKAFTQVRNARLLVFKDVPLLNDDSLNCANSDPWKQSQCSISAPQALADVEDTKKMLSAYASSYDMIDLFSPMCANGICDIWVPGTSAVAYVDSHHLNMNGCLYLAPFICAEMRKLGFYP